MDSSGQSKRKAANVFIEELLASKHNGSRECEFYITLTMANIELIWCNESEDQDAFTHPIYDHISKRSKWMIENNFIAVFPWRTSKTINKIRYNITATKVGQSVFPRRYYLRIVDPNESTPTTRFEILKECAKVMKLNTLKYNNTYSVTKSFHNEYIVPPDYDKTPEILLPLDHYLLDCDVYTLVKKLFANVTEWSKWANENHKDAICYLSPPFKSRESYLLGYVTNEQK